uniref:DB domain-containing protein n=1 Tax=Ditylenchus dipsaci TaxID=166011 RepID=A0A915D3E9_9BILA
MTTSPPNCLDTCAGHTREIISTISLLGAANLFLHQDVTTSLCKSYGNLKTCLDKCGIKSNHFSFLEMPCRFQSSFSEAINCYQT